MMNTPHSWSVPLVAFGAISLGLAMIALVDLPDDGFAHSPVTAPAPPLSVGAGTGETSPVVFIEIPGPRAAPTRIDSI